MNPTSYQALVYAYKSAAAPTAPALLTPTLLLLHGTGGDERDLVPLAARFGTGINVLSLRGNVMEAGMPHFFRRLDQGVFDEGDVRHRTHELVHFLRAVSHRERFDLTKLVAVGYSNGANIAGSVLMLYPDLLAGAVLWRPMQPLVREVPAFATARRQPVLFSPGTHDPTVAPAASAHYAALLALAGFDLTRWDAEGGHNLTPADVTTAASWFRQHFLS
ncbi:alpha/beta hydrolase [Hymenobacter terricola]|uniref:alpha/beta hydrolase n=1 Tax=Hymenobacter terricola TaxID=2819236 RepID=UPI001B3182FA|nr:hypothetical protein [Hymenobacter terricola]